MKKLILSIALFCFLGAAKIQAQSSDAKAATPSTSAAVVVPAADATVPATVTQSGDQSVQTPGVVKTEAKAETKKSGCKHSSKACCMSKDGASKKECKDKHSEKAEVKSEKSDTKVN